MNPLLKKYHVDGPVPPSYIPPNKRKMISRYMGKSSFLPGNYSKFNLYLIILDPSTDPEGNKTTKQGAEEKN